MGMQAEKTHKPLSLSWRRANVDEIGGSGQSKSIE
jgi:hypothetical protein